MTEFLVEPATCDRALLAHTGHAWQNFSLLESSRIEQVPWPIADETYQHLLMWNLDDHLPRQHTKLFIDECWRILRAGGQLHLKNEFWGCPYCAHENRWVPQRIRQVLNEKHQELWKYFDCTNSQWEMFKPRCWKLAHIEWEAHGDDTTVLIKRTGSHETHH